MAGDKKSVGKSLSRNSAMPPVPGDRFYTSSMRFDNFYRGE
ncbi:MAG TPA: hypothetical protein VLL54_15065 [Pyrinomonadaceae bacterium]|nr:hypothetical protein [Pyrinomonadaceae bacterium]